EFGAKELVVQAIRVAGEDQTVAVLDQPRQEGDDLVVGGEDVREFPREIVRAAAVVDPGHGGAYELVGRQAPQFEVVFHRPVVNRGEDLRLGQVAAAGEPSRPP